MATIESTPEFPPTRYTCEYCTTTFMSQAGDETGITIVESNPVKKRTGGLFSGSYIVQADGKYGFLVPCPRCRRELVIVPSQPFFPVEREYHDDF